jgi:hypothetical protein
MAREVRMTAQVRLGMAAAALAALTACGGNRCEDLDPEACASSAACTVIDGRRITDYGEDTGEGACYVADPLSDLACMAAETACTQAETFAQSPEGDCFWFNDGCVPAGFGTCDLEPTYGECPA